MYMNKTSIIVIVCVLFLIGGLAYVYIKYARPCEEEQPVLDLEDSITFNQIYKS